jgi:glycosyltransferase involved in cell wall biosynthesis
VDLPNNSLSRNLWFATGLPALAERTKSQVMHLSFPIPLFIKRRIKTVATVHDLYPYDLPENIGFPKVYFIRAFFRSCLENSDAITCVSNSTLNRLKATILVSNDKPMVAIPNAIDFTDVESRRPPWVGSRPFVLMVAQHRVNKNLSLAIDGFERMLYTGVVAPNSNLVIVGSQGPETPTIQDAVRRKNLSDRLKFASCITEAELRWLYEHCLFFLATSSVEGFCIPLVEAMSFNSNIVCSDIPVFREIGSRTCCYFDLSNDPVQAMTDAARRALELPSQGHDYSAARYSTKAVGKQYVALYNKLAEGREILGNSVDSSAKVASVDVRPT